MREIDNAAIHGGVPEQIHTLVRHALQAEVGARAARPRRLGVVVIAAALVLALACTALAMSLVRSARSEAIQQAREAVCAGYGFTQETLGIFYSEAEAREDGWAITFLPIKYRNQLGSYQVTLPAEGEATVAWSHDGKSFAHMETGALDSELWGPLQVERALALDKAYGEAFQEMGGDMRGWTLEQRAELDTMLRDVGYHERGQSINTLPTPDEMQPEEALQTALDTVSAEFGLNPSELSAYRQMIFFREITSTENRYYTIYLSNTEEEALYETGMQDDYIITLAASGTVTACDWNGTPENARLPEGPLEGKTTAVRAFFNAGAFEALSHEKKAALAERLSKTSFGASLLRGVQYELPGGETVDETGAYALALEALQDAYGLTAEMVDTLFEVQTTYQRVADYPAWVVEMEADPMAYEITLHRGSIGHYRVVVDAETGLITVLRWSMDGLPQTPYDDATWAGALLWDADILARMLTLSKQLSALDEEYPGLTPFDSYEFMARRHALFRDNGFDRNTYRLGLPAATDVQREEATELALSAICETFETTRDDLSASFRVAWVNFIVTDPQQPVWSVDLYSTVDGREDAYFVTLDGNSGEILDLTYMAQGNG